MRQEIAELEKEGSNYGEIKVNTDKFLSLELPPSHSEGNLIVVMKSLDAVYI